MPDVWAPALLEQLKQSLVFHGPPFVGPLPKPVLYRLVEEDDSALACVLDEELYWNVAPAHERAEAIQVMIDALNGWISERIDA